LFERARLLSSPPALARKL
jgi:hypothetical protein